ncbi:hypothetical protein CEK26_007847 [Fusarium fujikuroi]|nr:hypothetical protein CEK27_007867 [Fusarium fujikuroi]QGI81166.1 hypothetical protein CEK25_007895 [Fusarium fujikuroi]QGI94778.1 hypothetical protein CEK26_007847 [Fusarium fujikuroi]
MDPFDRLPAEVRIKILGSIPSHATTARLIRASPAMLAQYTTTESTYLREYLLQLVGTDANDHGLLQDALAIIYLSETDDLDQISDILHEWKAKTLPLPFRRGDNDTTTKLRLLFERMGEFIDDYLSKATAQNTAEAYLRPPRRTYIDTVDPQLITLHDLNPQERLRLFQAFIKFEVLCKFSNERVYHALTKLRPKLKLGLSSWEKKALMCVYEYMKASYSAMFVQYAGAKTFKDYKKTCDSLRRVQREDSFFVETMCCDPQYPFRRYKSLENAAYYPKALPFCGFDVLSHLMMEAKAEHQPMRIARMCSKYDRRSCDSAHHIRAWAFFDDARLCPGQEAHFPTEEEVTTEVARLEAERKMNTRKQWQEYFAKKRSNPPRYKPPLKLWGRNDYTTAEKTLEDCEANNGGLVPPPFFALPEARHRG